MNQIGEGAVSTYTIKTNEYVNYYIRIYLSPILMGQIWLNASLLHHLFFDRFERISSFTPIQQHSIRMSSGYVAYYVRQYCDDFFVWHQSIVQQSFSCQRLN